MKTLVIHAEDATTDFLSTIYDGKDWTIITKNIGKSKLKAAVFQRKTNKNTVVSSFFTDT